MTSNVWEDQAAEDAPEQPGFTSKNKATALKELLSSVSTENQKSAGADFKTLLAATQDFNGRGAVVADGGNWRVNGMKTSLKHYQVLGAAFMRRRENGGKDPRGGLMADQMGLGKTLMMLANIVNGRPPRNDPIKTNLIVASPSLLLQWEREIKDHTDCNFRIMRYGTGNRPETQSSHAHELFTSQDIILTTYGEMLRSYPDNKPPETYQTNEEKAAWWRKKWETERGILHQIQFLRIVLDEAQAIKNYKGRTSLACRAVMATHRWALSGTPIIAFKAQVLTWLSENPDGKIIVYTQFLAMVRILAKICAEEDWPALQYTGKMSFGTRDKVLTKFAKPESQAKILLASLRCGGLGLNLTMANRVIMLDPWWNSAVEQQAFCPVFRIGQTELTYMTRFTVKDTVDERLMRMQGRKQREIDEIMEDDGTRTKKIGIQDMLRLFGVVNEGDEELSGTKPYILVDNPNSRGGFHADKNHEGYTDDI